MKTQTIAINEIKPNAFNPKRTELFVKETKRLGMSLEKFGQILPLLVRETEGGYEILNGYHRFKEMEAKGYKEVEVWNMGKVSNSKAKAILLSLEDSKVPLNRLKVAKLVDTVTDKNALAYTAEDIQTLKALAGIDFTPEEKPAKAKTHKVAIPEDRYLEWDTKKAGRTDDEFLLVLLERGLAQLK